MQQGYCSVYFLLVIRYLLPLTCDVVSISVLQKKKNNIGLSVSMDYNIKKMSITPSHLTCLLILFFRAILWTLAVRELFILKLS